MDELDSKDTPISTGKSIKIYVKSLDTKFLIQKTFRREINSKDLTDNTKSLSTLSNPSTVNNLEVTCFVKMMANIISFKKLVFISFQLMRQILFIIY